jgi:hypothetical protein
VSEWGFKENDLVAQQTLSSIKDPKQQQQVANWARQQRRPNAIASLFFQLYRGDRIPSRPILMQPIRQPFVSVKKQVSVTAIASVPTILSGVVTSADGHSR